MTVSMAHLPRLLPRRSHGNAQHAQSAVALPARVPQGGGAPRSKSVVRRIYAQSPPIVR